jgi:hypothetical protein
MGAAFGHADQLGKRGLFTTIGAFTKRLFTEVLRRISMKMSSLRAALERGAVSQHRPHYVNPPTC